MISSIKRFLLFYLLLSIVIISLLALIGNTFLFQRDVKRHFDHHLVNVSRLLLSLHTTHTKQLSNLPFTNIYQFRAWSAAGKLILHSKYITDISTTKLNRDQDGFQTIKIKDHFWRFYTHKYKSSQIIIQVGESYTLQKNLVKNIIRNYLEVLIMTCLLLGILIWLTVDYGLKNLKILAEKLSRRSATALEALDVSNMPLEIKPIADELNNLFARLQKAFDRNKHFAADAAHELRTPLAALKTQAQVALLAPTLEESKKTIQKVIDGTNRCTHMVRQLLTLSRLGEEEALQDMQLSDLVTITTDMLAQLAPFALNKNIDIAFVEPDQHKKIIINEPSISILVRNLVDNAIRYTPEGGKVIVKVVNYHDGIALQVIDSGPGIPQELHPQVFERFYRVLGTNASGSGLGLPIVKQIADLHHAKINLSTPDTDKGLKIEVIFPTF